MGLTTIWTFTIAAGLRCVLRQALRRRPVRSEPAGHRFVQPAQDRGKTFRHAFDDDFAIQEAQLASDCRHGFAAELWRLHVRFHSPNSADLDHLAALVASDAVGIITVAPLAISLVKALREPPPRNETLEGVVALVVLAVMTAIIVSLPPEPWEPVAPVPLLFPILLWTTSRCQPVFAAVAAFIVSLTIMWTTTFGIIGHFGHPVLPIGDRILRSGGHPECRALRICSSALFAERRRHEALLQEALAAGALMAFECNPLSGLAQRSENAAQILELGPQQTLTVAQFLARIHPDDLVRFKAHNNRASVDPPGGRFRQCPQHRPSRHNRNHVQGRMPLRGG